MKHSPHVALRQRQKSNVLLARCKALDSNTVAAMRAVVQCKLVVAALDHVGQVIK